MSKVIEFTEYQYKTLMKMIYVAEIIINSDNDEPNEDVAHIENYIYSNAEKFGLGDLVVYDKDELAFIPTEKFETDQDLEGMLGDI